MIYLLLFTEFFKIGIFSFGGGYATLPFLSHMSETYGWFSLDELSRMLAISSVTPGPVGLNVATFAGFKTGGILGSIDATLAIMIPSFIIVIFISKMLKKFEDNIYVQSALYALRPAAAAMIGAVCVRLLYECVILKPDGVLNVFKNFENVDIKALVVIVLLFIISLKLKKDPLTYLLLGAVFGVVFHFSHYLTLI